MTLGRNRMEFYSQRNFLVWMEGKDGGGEGCLASDDDATVGLGTGG